MIEELGCAIIGQTSRVAPADKKLYALRDVTATVECVPLIVGSILSKKISEGSDGLATRQPRVSTEPTDSWELLFG